MFFVLLGVEELVRFLNVSRVHSSYYYCFNLKKKRGGGPKVKYMSDILQDTLNLKEFIDIHLLFCTMYSGFCQDIYL